MMFMTFDSFGRGRTQSGQERSFGPLSLKLFTNGVLSITSQAPDQRVFDLSNSEPLLIGFGAQTYFAGALSDLRLYAKALTDADVRHLSDKPSRK